MRQILRDQRRALGMTKVRERKRRMKGREMSQMRSVVSRTVCDQVLLLRQGKGDQAELRPDGMLRLGEVSLSERHVRLVASNLSDGRVVVKTGLGHRSAGGKTNASGLGKS